MSTITDPYQSAKQEQSRKTSAWFNPRDRNLGMLAFILNRVTALGLVFYLAIHLIVLSLLAIGASTWDTFIAIVSSPFFLAMDIVLLAGVLIHGLNGIRLTLIGLGFFANRQRELFVILMIIALILLVMASIGILTI